MIMIIKSWCIHKVIRQLIYFGIIFVCLIIPATTKVEAKTLVFSDDFSDGLNKWESVRPNAQYWSINDQGQAHAYIPDQSTVVELVPKDIYWDNTWQNIEFDFDYITYEGGDKNFGFGYQDSNNWHEFHFISSANELVKVMDGQVVWSAWHGSGFNNGSTYAIKLILNNGKISLYINDVLSSEDIDPSYDNDFGKITIKAGTGAISPTSVAFDNIEVYNLDTQEVPPYVFKQHDSKWAEKEYDSAHLWSQDDSSMKRWGCAVSSLAMIMRYHHIELMPDGQMVNPDTINTWLTQQPDGYVGDGLVNWQAGARLTKIINRIYETTELEYSFLAGDQKQVANDNIAQHNPIVVAIPGHFLLADGVTADQNDWTIRDPAYVYSLFSQHNVAADSFRLFTPSQTDLSYIIISHPPDLKIDIKNGDNLEADVSNHTEYLTADDNLGITKNHNLAITQITKPISGNYQLGLTQSQVSKTALKFYLYDSDGNVKVIDYSAMVGFLPTQLNLDFNNTHVDQSQLSEATMTFQTWAELLEPLYEHKDIERKFAVIILKNAATTAGHNLPTSTADFISYIKSLILWLSPAINNDTRDYLIQALNQISVI